MSQLENKNHILYLLAFYSHLFIEAFSGFFYLFRNIKKVLLFSSIYFWIMFLIRKTIFKKELITLIYFIDLEYKDKCNDSFYIQSISKLFYDTCILILYVNTYLRISRYNKNEKNWKRFLKEKKNLLRSSNNNINFHLEEESLSKVVKLDLNYIYSNSSDSEFFNRSN